jgi:hypothetical protein
MSGVVNKHREAIIRDAHAFLKPTPITRSREGSWQRRHCRAGESSIAIMAPAGLDHVAHPPKIALVMSARAAMMDRPIADNARLGGNALIHAPRPLAPPC